MTGNNHTTIRSHPFSSSGENNCSIITIVLNGTQNIEQTINSVLAQTFQNIEYVIIDGGSVDGTLDIIKKYEDKISRWISEPDNGISDAFNKGIKLAAGEIIGIVNSDDWLEPDAVEKVMKIFESRNPDVVCGAARFWENGENVNVSYPNLKSFHRETSIHHSSVFIKRSAYEKYGLYDETFKYAMDYELMLRMKMSGAKYFLFNEIISNRRLQGISYKNRKHSLLETRKVRSRYFSPLNIWSTYLYVLAKDLSGRWLKNSPMKSLYRSYWNLKNSRLSKNGMR